MGVRSREKSSQRQRLEPRQGPLTYWPNPSQFDGPLRRSRENQAAPARIALSRSGDPATGEFGDAKLIRKFGDVPDDSSAL
jgi:hypothetical protein